MASSSKKITFQFTVTVPSDLPDEAVRAHMSDALSIGCEHLDEDPGTEMPGMVGTLKVVPA